MYKLLVVFAFFAVAAIAAPTEDKEKKEIIAILHSESNKNDDGSYNIAYEGADGTFREEKAVVVDAGTDEEALEVNGSYKYINEEGNEVEVFYTAGKNGFVPHGSIINPAISAAAAAAKDLPKEYDEKMVAPYEEEVVQDLVEN